MTRSEQTTHVQHSTRLDDPQARRIRDLEVEQGRTDELVAYLQDQLVERELAYQHLEGAIASSRRIGAAIGIVMSVSRVAEDEAFGMLVRISMLQNRKLRLVADDIVLTGSF